VRRRFSSIAATPEEVAANRSGDDIIGIPDAVMDRAFTLNAAPEQVWPWLVQLGKQRAGWYLPRTIERFIPRRHRAIRTLDPRWQRLAVGDVIPDYGGRHETFEVAHIDPPHTLVYYSERGQMRLSWSLTLTADGEPEATMAAEHSRLHLRLRLGPIKRKWLANTAGDRLDALTVAGLATGLRERLADG
jgi:uncharacterized protein YndB with AHSA1/START domain